MSEWSVIEEEEETIVLFQEVEHESSEEPPVSEWSSLVIEKPIENKKKLLCAEGLYSPDSGEVCGKYIALSNSDVFRHCYYTYPSVHDPGITDALFRPEKPVIYPDDGQDQYLAVCAEMKQCPIRMFHRGLLTKEINLNHYGVNPAGVRAIAMALEYNMNVERFSLVGNFLNDDACYHLGYMLKSNTTMTALNLSGCRIRPSGMLNFSQGIRTNRTLDELNLAGNDLGEEGGEHIAELLQKGSPISQINLSNNKFGPCAIIALSDAAVYANSITHLDLSWNGLNNPKTAKFLDELASNNNVLEEMNLAWNGLQGVRIAKAIQNLMTATPLTYLNLSNNRFCDEALGLLIARLGRCKKLVTFDLSFNPLTPSDANAVIQKMLLKVVKVQNLLLDNIYVDKAFLETLEVVKQMESRENFKIVIGGTLNDYDIKGPDMRELLLRRADFLAQSSKHNKVDIALVFLRLRKEQPKEFMLVKEVLIYLKKNGVVTNEALVTQLTEAFPGPKGKQPTLDLDKVVNFVQRLWPQARLPPTPPPEPEKPLLKPPPKGKRKRKKKKK